MEEIGRYRSHQTIIPKGVTVKRILLVLSSPRGTQSHSHQIAHRIVEDLGSQHAEAEIVVRDVSKEPLPYVGEAFVSGLFTPPEKRKPAEAKAIGVSDALANAMNSASAQAEEAVRGIMSAIP
jgi:FMN-dependent NADH-azoreductase